MPKLSRAQREARDAKRAAAAKTEQSIAASESSPSTATTAAVQPSPVALSTNQPVVQSSSGTKKGSSSAKQTGKVTKESKRSSYTRSPPSTTERIPSQTTLPTTSNNSRIRQQQQNQQTDASFLYPVPYSPPDFAASDVSTTDESEDEMANGDNSVKAGISLMDEHADGDDDEMMGDSANVGGEDNPEVKCMWEDCGEVFNSLIDFINHLHDEHVGIHRARYSCEWSGCPRKGKAQTSRFALLSHLRSHTGEKPFTCPRPGKLKIDMGKIELTIRMDAKEFEMYHCRLCSQSINCIKSL